MVDLDKLMALNGAIGAFKMTDKGELLEHRVKQDCDLNETILDLLCHVCIANMSIATMQARGWEKMTGMQGFYPVSGISLIGFDWSALVHGQYGVVMPNENTDFDMAYEVLSD